jgi:hypothetical protein
MMLTVQNIVDYLSDHISDPVPKYILIKEILKKAPSSPEYLTAYDDVLQSKWYYELADEQLENGSWGRFHGQDTKDKTRRKFACTEVALRRARELSLDKDDPIITKCIKILERYVRGDETYPDPVEKHQDGGRGHMLSRPYMAAANMNIFDPENPLIKPLRDSVLEALEKAFEKGYFDENVWEQEVRDYRVPGITVPGCVYGSMLLHNVNCMDETLQRQYLKYVWSKKDGIGYISKFPPADKRKLEDKSFYAWLALLESLCGFSLFPDFMRDDVLPFLLNEVDRLLNENVTLPPPPGAYSVCSHHVYGRYAESWRDKNKQKTDMVLRLARIIVKC